MDSFLEGPSFDRKGNLYCVDIPFGRVFRVDLRGRWELVVQYDGWPNGLKLHKDGRVFIADYKRGLMLLDFDEHRLHRKELSVAFKSGPMKSYLGELDKGIAARVAQWRAKPGTMQLYPAMKQLTLDLAATSFLGADIGPEVNEINRAFVDMVAAAVTPIRYAIPGTQMARGVAGRKRIEVGRRNLVLDRRYSRVDIARLVLVVDPELRVADSHFLSSCWR